MATAQTARAAVSQDVGDYWASSSTSASGNATTLVDKQLINENDDAFVTKRAQVFIVDGALASQEAGIASKSGATLTVKAGMDFTGNPASGINYEVHRLFTRKEKDDVVTRAVNRAYPTLFKIVQEEVTIVDDQHEYTTTNFTFHKYPSLVQLVSDEDTEITWDLFDWEMVPDTGKLRLRTLPAATRKVRLTGILAPALTDIAEPQLQILSAMAAIELVEQAIAREPIDVVGRWQSVLQRLERDFAERKAKHAQIAPPYIIRTPIYALTRDITFKRA